MVIYPKRIRNVQELEKERKLLQKQHRKLDKEEFLSWDDVFSNKDENGKVPWSVWSLLSYIPVSHPVANIGLKVLQWRLTRRKNPKEKKVSLETPEKKGKSILIGLTVEVLGGYLKWKAIELSYKGIKKLVAKRKENIAVVTVIK